MKSQHAGSRPEFHPPSFRRKLLAWYDAHARQLPWRRDRDPYRVWVSEIMLQQTRVAAVIAHYREFLRRFPTVQKLAAAQEASVLAAWSGLGYYRRARMLHATAKVIVRELGGAFPEAAQKWRKLLGIGRYTAAAIASIAFSEPVAVVDGNVERVLERVIGKTLLPAELWQAAEELLDRERPGDFNQAIMELGATVCTPQMPACLLCPVLNFCATRGEIAGRASAARQVKREIDYALHCRNGSVLLMQRPHDIQLMPGMWELPEVQPSIFQLTKGQIPRARSSHSARFAAARNDSNELNCEGKSDTKGNSLLFTLRHSITVNDYTVRVWDGSACAHKGGHWIARRRLPQLPLTGLARKILRKSGAMS